MYKMIFAALLCIANADVLSQELTTSKDSLYFPEGLEYDTIAVYNIGSAPLIVNSIQPVAEDLGYRLYLLFRDSTNFYFVFRGMQPLNVTITPNDSIRLAFSGAFCDICKSQSREEYYDTLIIHSNSLSNNYKRLPVKGEGTTSVRGNNAVANDYALFQNYPNPFNPATTIPFSLAHEDFITLTVYNNLGQLVAVVFSGKLEAGNYNKRWDGSNSPSGVYFYEIKSSKFTATGRMILAK